MVKKKKITRLDFVKKIGLKLEAKSIKAFKQNIINSK